MENQVILACVVGVGYTYFSKWVYGNRFIGSDSPYSAIKRRSNAASEPFDRGGNIPLILGPLIKWSED